MKLSHRLGLIVACAILGLLLIASIALQSMRGTMLNDRRQEIHTVLTLAAKQIAYYQSLEKSGQLSRDEAQNRAIEALTSMREGDSLYLWAKTADAKTLVHPNAKSIGKVNWGAKLPNGKTTWQNYLDNLSNTNFAYFDDMSRRVNAKEGLNK